MLGAAINGVVVVLGVGLIILVHELGHFFAAKAVGMRVEVFAIGFWKKIVSVTVGETEYRLAVIPLGGMVKVAGESPDEGGGEPYEFWSKSLSQRALFIVGGVVMNVVFALLLFIAAFAIGVPFMVAEVGTTTPGKPAWEGGLKPGDKIVAIGGKVDPVFEDVTRAVALGGSGDVVFEVDRAGSHLTFSLTPVYDERAGVKVVGIRPPTEPVVTGLAKVGGEEGRCPAEEAGIEIGDRILALNGKRIETASDLLLELAKYPHDEVEVLVERDEQQIPLRVLTEPAPHYMIGIAGMSSTIESLEGGGVAQRLGLRVGDRIAAVNGRPVESAVKIKLLVREALGDIALTVVREGQEIAFTLAVPDFRALEEFVWSAKFEAGATLTRVKEGGPAWDAGMRPGDTIVSKAGKEVSTWQEVLRAGGRTGRKEHEIQWIRDGEVLTARVTAVSDTHLSGGHLGILMQLQKTSLRRYGAIGAVRTGFVNLVKTPSDIFLTLRGFARRDVSPRQLGGIVLIAQASYYAAQRGIGMFLYMMAVISGAIAFVNILPIPVLDGGHLLFVAIEKVRGRRPSQRVLTIAQTVGFVFLVLLVFYATRNDIMRLLGW